MSRYVEAETLVRWICGNKCGCERDECGYDIPCQQVQLLENAPSIDIVRCGECEWEWTQKCPPHRMGLIHDASDYCSYGIRKTDGVDKHDEAVEALGHLIKRMKGADDEVR